MVPFNKPTSGYKSSHFDFGVRSLFITIQYEIELIYAKTNSGADCDKDRMHFIICSSPFPWARRWHLTFNDNSCGRSNSNWNILIK